MEGEEPVGGSVLRPTIGNIDRGQFYEVTGLSIDSAKV